MTRSDYIKISDAVATSRVLAAGVIDPQVAINHVMHQLAKAISEGNSGFDTKRFINDCDRTLGKVTS